MPALVEVRELIADDLKKVCRIFDDELFSELPVVNELCAHIEQYRGKMLRPSLLLLSAQACGQVTETHLTLAAVIEMVHMATLVHDDVLDDGDLRRRLPTINKLRGNEAAVLLGDYLISHAYRLCSSLDSQQAAQIIGATTNTIGEGEIQQVHHRGDLDLTLDQYLQIIARKTASLLGTSCRLGAIYADADETMAEALEQFGTQTGIAFQITDDVLDITGSEKCMGKTLGRDLAKGKLTLPVIHALHNAGPEQRSQLCDLLSNGQMDRPRLRDLLDKTHSITYALDAARKYIHNALDRLKELPESPARDALTRSARSIIERQE